MSYYHECPECGATLDPGEKCDCGQDQRGLWLDVYQVVKYDLDYCNGNPNAAKERLQRSVHEYQVNTGKPIQEKSKDIFLKAVDVVANLRKEAKA